VQRRKEQAEEDFLQTVQRGEPGALYNLAEAYQNGHKGEGAPSAYDKARRLFSLAAQQGHVGALYVLGEMSYTGKGSMPHDKPRGLAWMEAAAAKKFQPALEFLAQIAAGGEPSTAKEAALTSLLSRAILHVL